MDIPRNSKRPTVRNTNPITSDPALTELLQEAKNLDSENEFKGWKDSFLRVYRQYLDPAGVDNARASESQFLRSMEKLAATVVSVNTLVDEGKVSAESQTVMGKRALTNMTDQLAKTEQELARFMPTTGAAEQAVGYDKFELGAVMIEDGFHVYELLKSTQSIVKRLLEQVLNDVLPKNKLSIIQFYLRQIHSFCDVMADLGLFGLMEDVVEMYKVKPRSKEKPVTKKLSAIAVGSPAPQKIDPPSPIVSQQCPEEGPQIVELDPDKIYNFRSSFCGGYIDPFSGTAPGTGEEALKDRSDDKNEAEKGNDGDADFIIYFDKKTGCIGKVPRHACISKSFIVQVDDAGVETMEGEVEGDDEKEQLIWDMKKAMKSKGKGNGNNGLRSASHKSTGVSKAYVVTPKSGAKRSVRESKNGDVKGSLRGLQAPRLYKDEGNNVGNDAPRSPSTSKRLSSTGNAETQREESPLFNDEKYLSKRNAKVDNSTARNDYTRRKTDAEPSTDGWAQPNYSAKASKRPSVQSVSKEPKPSSDGWASASTLAAGRRQK
jgi:hypothetical protein